MCVTLPIAAETATSSWKMLVRILRKRPFEIKPMYLSDHSVPSFSYRLLEKIKILKSHLEQARSIYCKPHCLGRHVFDSYTPLPRLRRSGLILRHYLEFKSIKLNRDEKETNQTSPKNAPEATINIGAANLVNNVLTLSHQ